MTFREGGRSAGFGRKRFPSTFLGIARFWRNFSARPRRHLPSVGNMFPAQFAVWRAFDVIHSLNTRTKTARGVSYHKHVIGAAIGTLASINPFRKPPTFLGENFLESECGNFCRMSTALSTELSAGYFGAGSLSQPSPIQNLQ